MTGQASLVERFELFVHGLDGYENIDALLKGFPDNGKKHADYLFDGRRIIVEQKSIEGDPGYKLQEFAEKLMREDRILVYGKVSLDMILRNLPNEKQLRHELAVSIAKRLDEKVADADKQFRDTRLIFDIPEATGILVLLNEDVSVLAPDVIYYGLANTYKKKGPDGGLRYAHADGVVLITEANPSKVLGFEKAFQMIPFASPHKRNPESFTAFTDMLMARWAAFNDAPLISAEHGKI
jgi:hypothetical protein